jgi:hypothetical protein
MAENPAQDYGEDIACVVDADELFSEAEGVDVVQQDCIHVITQEDVLGPGGDQRGVDVRKYIGAKQTFLTSQQLIVSEVIERDDRISHADVILTAIVSSNGLADVQIQVSAMTDFGPFSFTKNVSDLTATELEAGEG